MKRLLVRKRVWLPLLFILTAGLGGPYLALRLFVNPEEIKATVERMLSEQFGGRARVERVKIGVFHGVELRGVSVSKSDAKGLAPFLQVKSLWLKNYLKPLLRGRFVIEEVDIDQPTVFLTRNADGRWNIQQTTGEPSGGGGMAASGPSALASLSVHDATIEIRDQYAGQNFPSMRILGVNFSAISREPGNLPFTITGRIASSILGQCLVSGSLDLDNGVFNLSLSRKGLVLDDELAKNLRTFRPDLFRVLGGWRGLMDLRFNLTYDLIGSGGVKYRLMAKLLGDSLTVKGLPYSFQSIYGAVTLTDEKLVVQNVRGRWGSTRFVVDGALPLANPAGRPGITVSLLNVPLDPRLAALAGKEVSEAWKEFKPTGQFDVLCRLDGCLYAIRDLRYRASIFLKECGFSHQRLDVPIERINGQIDVTRERLHVRRMTALWRGIQIEMPPASTQLSADAPVDFVLRLASLPLDEKLKALLPPDHRASWDQFSPKGVVNAAIHVRRKAGAASPFEATVALTCVKDCEFTYKQFPRTLRNVQGVVEFRSDGVAFRGVKGSVGAGKVEFVDTVIPFDPCASFNFEFTAADIEFDRELYDALSPELKAVYDRINPSGRFDLEWHQERRRGPNARTIHDVVVRPRGAAVLIKDVPYPLNNLQGTILYDGERISLDKLTAQNGPARVAVEGRVPRSSSSGTLHVRVAGRNIPLDDSVQNVLPEGYQGLWGKIEPQGAIHFSLELNEGIDELGKPLVRYTVPELRLLNCAVRPKVPVTGIRGLVKFTGEIREDPRNSWASGEVVLDEAVIEGKKYDSVNATFHNERDLMTFPYIEARCYGGKVVGELKVNKGASVDSSGYEAFFRAENVSARQICESAGVALKSVDGAIFADFRAEARSWKAEDLNADGSFRISQGHLGDLVSMMGVTEKLNTGPAKPAFTDVDFDYIIAENEAVIEKARLIGPSINLKGEGKIGLDGNLSLEFHPEPGRGGPEIPVVSQFVGGMFGAAVTISVTGTVWNPVIKVDPLVPIGKMMLGLSEAFGAVGKKPKKAARPSP